MRPNYYSEVEIAFPIKAIGVTVEPPLGGTEVTTDEYWNQTNAPVARPAAQESYLMQDILAWWAVDEDATTPFTGTIEARKEYLVHLLIETGDGRDFEDEVRVTVNGEPAIRARKDEDQLFLVIALAKVRATDA